MIDRASCSVMAPAARRSRASSAGVAALFGDVRPLPSSSNMSESQSTIIWYSASDIKPHASFLFAVASMSVRFMVVDEVTDNQTIENY